MMYIKSFIDKVSAMEGKAGRDLLLSANEARMLRDEIAKILLDKAMNNVGGVQQVQETVISGGKFK